MTERKARKLLSYEIKENGDLVGVNDRYNPDGEWIGWSVGEKEISLSGSFTREQLEAMVWWMKNHA